VRPSELIVVDDGSDDDSASVIDERSLPFPVRVVRQANAGQSSARNHGARLAEGDVIALLDQDDRWYPQHLERLLVPFLDQPDLGFCYSDLDEIDGNGGLVCLGRLHWSGASHPKRSLWELLAGDMFIVPSATVIRREAFLAVGGFDEQFSGYEDDDLFIRMFRAGYTHAFINESLSQWRIHRSSTSYTDRMNVSRRLFAEKLMAMCPDDPTVEHWWVRDYIAPRFFRRALHQFHRAALRADWPTCRESQEEAQQFADRMVCGPRLRTRLALMRRPRVYRLLYQWWRRDPSLISPLKSEKPEPIIHPRI
jgi:glycosyltransferase involved in cell wall biosynthesis